MPSFSTSLPISAELPIAGELVGTGYEGWSARLRAEFEQNATNGQVGQRLLSETDRVRVGRSGSLRANASRRTGTYWTTSGPRSPPGTVGSTPTTAPPAR